MKPLPVIQSLILSQFHNKKGFSIIDCIQPQPLISPAQFTIYSQLILFRQQLCNRLLVSEYMDRYYLIGIPQLSVNTDDNQVYERAKYLYAGSILVERDRYMDAGCRAIYREIVMKVGSFFRFLQQTSHVVYNNVENKQYLHYLLKKIYTHVNSGEQCVLSHFSTCYTVINLNISPYQRDSKPIKKSHVPITYLSEQQIENIQSELGRKLLNYAKVGDFNIKKICELVSDEKSVYRYYEKCMEMGMVFMVDMFSLENRYCLTENVHRYVGRNKKEPELELRRLCEQVTIRKGSNAEESENNLKITPNVLLYLYFQISRKDSLKKIIDNNLQLFANINIVKWLRISQTLGIIQRVHEKFAIDSPPDDSQQFCFITEESLRTHLYEPKMAKNTPHPMMLRQQCERMNSLFNAHVKNMDTVDEICVGLKVSKAVLMNLVNFGGQRCLKMFYVEEKQSEKIL